MRTTMKETFRWFLAVVAVSVLSFVQDVGAADEKGFRTVPIPEREHGYSGFESVVIDSQTGLDALLKRVKAGEGWNDGAKFIAAVKEAKIDFSKEALVLLRHTEGSGSTRVEFSNPKLRDGTLQYEIIRKTVEIGMVGTADMAFYCFALAVKKTAVNKVKLRIAGRKPVVLLVGK